MGPRVKFTKEQVIDAAFEIAKAEGINNITMKKIAGKMGGSVAPIYVNFKNINELTEALMDKIINISQQLLIEENTGNPFSDIGRASLRFAKEYSILFRDMIMRSNDYKKGYDEKMFPVFIEEMKKDPELEGFTEEELKTILFKVSIFQTGLSVMVANGLMLKDYSQQDLMNILSSATNDVILSTRVNKTKINI